MNICIYGTIILFSFFAMRTGVAAQETKKQALLKFFDQGNTADNSMGMKIYNDTENLNKAMLKARSESPEKGLSTLNHALAAYTKALSKKEARSLKSQIEDRINAEREQARQMAAIRKIRVAGHGNGPFVIRKRINWENDWTLILVPYSERETVIRIWNFYRDHNKKRALRDKYKKMADNYKRKGDFYIEAAISSLRLANDYYKDSSAAADKGNQLFKELCNKNRFSFDMSTNICSLYNLNIPVMIVAKERYLSGHEFIDHFWYREYIPGRSGSYWEISNIY